jgi:hypothetical protein
MFCSIESVTLGVRNLESGLEFFRDRMGMRVVNDTRVSVGLLGAWRRPVHESVRLVDLVAAASDGASAVAAAQESAGRIRLACFEDCELLPVSGARSATNARSSTDALDATSVASNSATSPEPELTPPSRGVWALDMSSTGDGGARTADATTAGSTSSQLTLVAGPDALPLIVSKQTPANLSAIWVASNDLEASARFYGQTLGLNPSNSGSPTLPLPSVNCTQRESFRSTDPNSLRIITAHFAPSAVSPAPMSVGQVGFNLITVRCDDLDELEKRLDAIGIAPITRPTHVGMPSGYPGRVMLAPGPNGELFEFDEITE